MSSNDLLKPVKGYSIWIKPTSKIKEKLSKIMISLSRRFNSPVFEPHVTLAEGIGGRREELFSKLQELADSLTPFKIELMKIDDGRYFKNIVVLVKKSKELMEAHLKARRIFKLEKKKYIPHLTLLWKVVNQEERREVIEELGNQLNITFEAENLHLVPIGEIPEEWKSIKEVKLR